jgi:Fe-S cluster biogenesis protein NfuA
MSAPPPPLEVLLEELEALPDVNAREKTREVVKAVLDLHAAGLEKLISLASARGQRALVESLATDPLVGSLLSLHGLHPLDLPVRVEAALVKLGPYFKLHGVDAHLAAVEQGVVRIELQTAASTCGSGCGGGAGKVSAAVLEAVGEAAPDAVRIDLDERQAPPRADGRPLPTAGFVPLEALLSNVRGKGS